MYICPRRICDNIFRSSCKISKINNNRIPNEIRSKANGLFIIFCDVSFLNKSDYKCTYICMTSRAYVQLPLNAKEIYGSIGNKIINVTHNLLVHLVDFYNERNPDIGSQKKYGGDIFS